MSEQFGSNSSVKVLQWLTQYKKLSSKAPGELTSFEAQTLKEVESKLAGILQTKSGEKSEIDTSRRQKLRVSANHTVRLTTAHDVKKAYIKNISGGGLFIETESMSAMGATVSLELYLPDELEPFTLKGVVAWTNPKKAISTPQGFGIRFIDLSEKIRKKIQRLVNLSLEQELKK